MTLKESDYVWRIAFVADNSGQWLINGLRFATKEEAEANVADLAMQWTMVTDTAVEECDDPVNYRWVEGRLVPVNPNCESYRRARVTARRVDRRAYRRAAYAVGAGAVGYGYGSYYGGYGYPAYSAPTAPYYGTGYGYGSYYGGYSYPSYSYAGYGYPAYGYGGYRIARWVAIHRARWR